MSSKIGRNEKCPCGSGLKYKKCCLRKDEEQAFARQAAEVGLEELVSDEDDAWALGGTMFARSAAESVARGEDLPGVEFHPWVVAQLRDRLGVGPHGRRPRHTISSVRAMDTGAILKALAREGVRIELARFDADAEAHISAWELSEEWEAARGADPEFLGLAASELWRRRLPHRPSLEMLDEQMQLGYRELERGRTRAACEVWLALWDALLEALPDGRTVAELDAQFVTGTNAVENWSGDCEIELHNLALDDPEIARRARSLYQRLVERFDDAALRFELAQLHGILGEDAEAEVLLAAEIEREPDDAGAYALLADQLRGRDPGRAAAVLERALARPVRNARDWDIQPRLDEVRARLGAGA